MLFDVFVYCVFMKFATFFSTWLTHQEIDAKLRKYLFKGIRISFTFDDTITIWIDCWNDTSFVFEATFPQRVEIASLGMYTWNFMLR